MRITDVHQPLSEEIDLFEVNMSPSNLKKMAAAIPGALAGMEFEMIVPGAEGDNEDSWEPDFDYDESISDFDDIVRFFTRGDNPNSRRDVADAISNLQSKYEDYAMEKEAEDWMEVQEEETRRWIEENEWDEDEKIREALEGMGLSEEEIEAAITAGEQAFSNSLSKEERESIKNTEAYHHWSDAEEAIVDMLDELVADEVQNQGTYWQSAQDDWRGTWDYPSESDFLDSEGYSSMRDIYNDGDLQWPYISNGGNGGEPVEGVAEDFGNAIGRPWNASSSYHGAKRAAGKYVVEPDGSLEPDDPSSEAGLEFVSPPLPVTELLNDLRKVVQWAKRRGCYTNESTGLHMNVSVPGFSLEKLDYVKLALFIGDKYILDSFGRSGNTYCKSALELVKKAATPEKAAEVMARMKTQLNTVAGKIIHSGITNKYTSINTKDGYIEFRSPGGNWLDANVDVLENTLLRFVVGMDIALDETAHKEEYAKKLYKLIAPSDDNTNTLQYFAKYSAGEIPKAALRSFIKQAQLQRKVAKDKTSGKKYWWNVQWDNNRRMEVVAGSKEVAKQVAAEEWGVPESQLAGAVVTPLRPYEEVPPAPENGGTGNWGIWAHIPQRFVAMSSTQGSPLRRFETQDDAQAWLNSTSLNQERFDVAEIPADYQRPATQASAQNQGNWGLWLGANQRFSRVPGTHPPGQEPPIRRFPSQAAAMAWLENHREQNVGVRNDIEVREIPAEDPSQFRSTENVPREGQPRNLVPTGPGPWEIYRISNGESVRELGHTNRMAAEEEARSALGLRGEAPELYGVRTRQAVPGSTQDLQQQRAAGGFTGAWKVMLNGQEVYRFSGVGNSQADANRVAASWLRQNGYGVSGEGFEVYPVMG